MRTRKSQESIDHPATRDVRPLGDVVQPTRPRVKPSEKPDLPFIGMENIEPHTMRLLGTVPAGTMKSSAVHFQPNDVLYGRLRPYLNKVYRPDFEGLCSAEFIVFPKSEAVNSRYLQYFLNSSSFVSYASHLNAGDRPRVDFEQLSSYPFPVAPPDEQKAIVAEIEKQFSRLDEAVASLKRTKANLNRYKAAVLKAAVEGKLTEDWRKEHPDVEPASQLLKRILAERREKGEGKGKYKEPESPEISGLPALPEEWLWTVVDQLGTVQLGRQRSPKNRSKDHPVQYIRAANITESGLDLSDLLDMEFLPHEQERYRLKRGDLLLSEASGSPNQVGKPAVWQDQLPLCCFQNTVIRLRPSVDLSSYLLTCFNSYYINGVFAKVASGVGINHLSADKFSKVTIPLPPLNEQKHIVAEVERRISVIDELEAAVDANLTRADRLRQTILQQAFSGRLLSPRANDSILNFSEDTIPRLYSYGSSVG